MKFHCDQCKTKYSISDDRVRGKILKIRCKSCGAVITVRQPSKAPAIPADAASKAKAPPQKPLKKLVTNVRHLRAQDSPLSNK